jgi:hypothetical protein
MWRTAWEDREDYKPLGHTGWCSDRGAVAKVWRILRDFSPECFVFIEVKANVNNF